MDTFINESWLLAQLEILVKKKKTTRWSLKDILFVYFITVFEIHYVP